MIPAYAAQVLKTDAYPTQGQQARPPQRCFIPLPLSERRERREAPQGVLQRHDHIGHLDLPLHHAQRAIGIGTLLQGSKIKTAQSLALHGWQ